MVWGKSFSRASASEIHILSDFSLTVAGWHFPYAIFLKKTLNLPLKSSSHRGRAVPYQIYSGGTKMKFRSLWWSIPLSTAESVFRRLISKCAAERISRSAFSKSFPISYTRTLHIFPFITPVHSVLVVEEGAAGVAPVRCFKKLLRWTCLWTELSQSAPLW